MQMHKNVKLGLFFLSGFPFCLLLTIVEPGNASKTILKTEVSQLVDSQFKPSKFNHSLLASNLINSIDVVRKELGQDSSRHKPIAIPLGTNSPLGIGDLADGGQLNNGNYMAVGYLTLSGKIQPINGDYILRGIGQLMTEKVAIEGCKKVSNHIPIPIPGAGHYVRRMAENKCENHAEDATNKAFNTSSDLVVYNDTDKHLYIVENANPHALFRDAINDIFNHKLRKNFNFSSFSPLKSLKIKGTSNIQKLPPKLTRH